MPDPLTMALLISGGLGAAGGLAGLFRGGDADISLSDIDAVSNFRPRGAGRLGDELMLQAMIQLGATPADISDAVLYSRIAENRNPSAARGFMSLIDSARSAAAQGNTSLARQYINTANQTLAQWNLGRTSAAGATFSLDQDGQVVTNFTGELGERLRSLDTSDTFANRVEAFGNLSELAAGFPVTTEDEIRAREDLLRRSMGARLSDIVGDRRRDTIEEANRLGFNPSAELGDISREELLLRQEIDSEAALARALQLLGGQTDLATRSVLGIQTALDPSLAPFALQGQTLSAQGDAAGLSSATSLASVLAQLNAQAEQNRSASLLDLGGDLLSSGVGRLSTNELIEALGGGGVSKPRAPQGRLGRDPVIILS